MATKPVLEIRPPDDLLEATRNGVEIWRHVLGTDGMYEVSNLGRVRSWAKTCRWGGRLDKPRILALNPNSRGYPLIQLWSKGKRRMIMVHIAMCESFICPRPSPAITWQGAHDDDQPTNNVLTNLKWCTQSANRIDQWNNGRLKLRPSRMIDGVECFRCTKCDSWKPRSGFPPITSEANGSRCRIASRCRKCASEDRRKYKRTRRTSGKQAAR